MPHECVGDYENVREVNPADYKPEWRVSTIRNVRTKIKHSVILRLREISQKSAARVRSYVDVAKVNNKEILRQ